MAKKKKGLGHKTFRLDDGKLERAKKRGIDVADLFRKTLDKVLDENTCPTCGHHLK